MSRVVAVLGFSRRRGAEDLHAICVARLERGQELAADADHVILSGFPEAELMRTAWTGPDVELIPEAESYWTAHNAANVTREARRLGARELVVVTSHWHRLRVTLLMRAAVRDTGIRVRVVSVRTPHGPRLLLREAACLVLLPFQLALAGR